MKWRSKGWQTLKAKNHPLHCFAPDACIGQAFEAGADALLETLKLLLTIIHAQLCGVRIEKGKTSWYSALDKSIDDISQILGKVNQ